MFLKDDAHRKVRVVVKDAKTCNRAIQDLAFHYAGHPKTLSYEEYGEILGALDRDERTVTEFWACPVDPCS